MRAPVMLRLLAMNLTEKLKLIEKQLKKQTKSFAAL